MVDFNRLNKQAQARTRVVKQDDGSVASFSEDVISHGGETISDGQIPIATATSLTVLDMTDELTVDQTVANIKTLALAKSSVAVAASMELRIESQEDFEEAAILRSRLKNAETKILDCQIKVKFDTTGSVDTVIKTIRHGLDKLYLLKRELTEPTSAADTHLKTEQQNYEKEKLRKKQEAERKAAEDLRKAREETARLEREAKEKKEQAEAEARAARTAEERRQAEAQAKAARDSERDAAEARKREELAKSTRVAAAALPSKTVAAGARTTPKKKPVVEDMHALIGGVLRGEVPAGLLLVNDPFLAEMWAEDRARVIAWPGITVIDEVIVGRR